MGWTSYNAKFYKNGRVDRKAEIENNVIKNDNLKVLKSSMIGSTYYGAIEHIESKEVFAVVILTSTNMKDYFNFSYKDMDETMGPGQCNCPKSILDLLTPTDNEYANEWRKRCYKNINKGKDKKALKNLPVGTRIKVTMPIDTTCFKQGDEVVLEKTIGYGSKRSRWVVVDRNVYFTNSLMKQLEDRCCFEIL